MKRVPSQRSFLSQGVINLGMCVYVYVYKYILMCMCTWALYTCECVTYICTVPVYILGIVYLYLIC